MNVAGVEFGFDVDSCSVDMTSIRSELTTLRMTLPTLDVEINSIHPPCTTSQANIAFTKQHLPSTTNAIFILAQLLSTIIPITNREIELVEDCLDQ